MSQRRAQCTRSALHQERLGANSQARQLLRLGSKVKCSLRAKRVTLHVAVIADRTTHPATWAPPRDPGTTGQHWLETQGETAHGRQCDLGVSFLQDAAASGWVGGAATAALAAAAPDARMPGFRSSTAAAAALAAGRAAAGATPVWPPSLASLTGHPVRVTHPLIRFSLLSFG